MNRLTDWIRSLYRGFVQRWEDEPVQWGSRPYIPPRPVGFVKRCEYFGEPKE